ncbi:unnamed protein product [Staurois parvus]|uniref:Uncharacterized protein n=1 Tax=Staurois parvus TaxID=386267 RepID=A0ABN9DAC7_9NEOB|nr:unnamed protein product [Staurois parvus]
MLNFYIFEIPAGSVRLCPVRPDAHRERNLEDVAGDTAGRILRDFRTR